MPSFKTIATMAVVALAVTVGYHTAMTKQGKA